MNIDIPNYVARTAPETAVKKATLEAVDNEAVQTVITSLYDSFIWSSHPWGEKFWSAVCSELANISEAARNA